MATSQKTSLKLLVREITFVGFALTLGVVVIGGVLGYLNIERLDDNGRQVANSHAVIVNLESLLSLVKDAETGQRGYLLTENKEYLQPHQEAIKTVKRTVDDLRDSLSDDPDQQARLAELEKALDARVNELRKTVALVDAADRPAAMAIIRSGSGKTMMDDLRRRVAVMREAEEAQLAKRASQSRTSSFTARLSNVFVAATGSVLVCALFYLGQKSLRDRKRAAEDVAAQRELLRVTLASIGDGVITTDSLARITFLNDVAKTVTGWTDEAVGQPVESVFRVIDEQTRKPLENPATKALKQGAILGMIGHCILIRKDGGERPIDDSAAPIKDEEGHSVGSVLIFRDITDRRVLEEQNAARLADARQLAAIVESSADAIVSKSLDGIIRSWNLAAQRLFGYSATEAIGKHISLIIPADRAQEEDQIIRRIRSGERVDHFETVRVKKNGQPVHVSLTISPIRDESGKIVGASKVARDITDRKEVEERIYNLLSDMKAADRSKDEFLAILAHELRGPLAPLRNCLEILKRGGGSAEIRSDARATMERQLDLLVRLVDDLLDVSRITRNKIELRRQRVDLSSIIEESMDTCRPLIEDKKLDVSVTLPPGPVYVYADAVRLVQVISNILNNACKYTDGAGQIWVNVESLGDEVLIKIRDNGMGIPADRLGSVFDMFTQVDRTLKHSQGGLGIGLTLVKRLVEMHEGSVEAHSAGPGRGSEFVVRLPIPPDLPSAEAPAPSNDTTVTAARVLVVDDNADAARSLATLLQVTGNEAHVEYDGLAAIAAAERLRPDLMLLDIGLPKLGGLDACRRIRAQLWGRNIVIVALTGWGQETDRLQTKDAGFDHHLVKPVSYQDLMNVLAESVRARAST